MERSGLSTEIFGTLANGETVEAVTLTNANGMSVKIIGYGERYFRETWNIFDMVIVILTIIGIIIG